MSALSRRNVLTAASSFAFATVLGRPGNAAMGPNDKYDLVIKGGDVLDPSQSLHGKRDIGIRYGLIEAWKPTSQPTAHCACSMRAASS